MRVWRDCLNHQVEGSSTTCYMITLYYFPFHGLMVPHVRKHSATGLDRGYAMFSPHLSLSSITRTHFNSFNVTLVAQLMLLHRKLIDGEAATNVSRTSNRGEKMMLSYASTANDGDGNHGIHRSSFLGGRRPTTSSQPPQL